MNAVSFVAFFKSKITFLALLTLLFCRFCQYAAFSAEALGKTNFAQGYALVNNLGFACFVLVPLFGFLLVYFANMLSSVTIVTRQASRKHLASRYLTCAFLQALFFSCALVVTSLPFVFPYYQTIFDVVIFLLITLLLQTAFFTLCALIFYLVLMVSRMVSIAYVVVLLYGLWDFMASNIVGGGIPFIGWGHTFILYPLDWASIVVNASLFLILAIMPYVALFIVTENRDFLTKQGV